MSWRLFLCSGCNRVPKIDAGSRQICSHCVEDLNRIMAIYTVLVHEYPSLRGVRPSLVIGRAVVKSLEDERVRDSVRAAYRGAA